MATEEERAEAYRLMMLARERVKAEREKALAGSTTKFNQLVANWEPLILALRERDCAGQEYCS